MANTTDPNVPSIVYSVTSKRLIEGELFIKQHVFDYIIAGTSEVYFGGKAQVYNAGDFRFVAKNRLSKFTKQPEPGGDYRSISICIDNNTLLEMKDYHLQDKKLHTPYDNIFPLTPNKFFKNYIDSLLPYLENGKQISQDLVKTKIKEAILIFMEANPKLRNILFDFTEPGKIDLEAYMNEHFQYNGDLNHFAYLTGRSLSTFKRDFQKIYSTTPNKWLLQKRLEQAHYLLKQKKMRSTDVYIDVGFKDYSHFSVAFKKAYGVAPSAVR
ncbi:MAG TPA: AraC family transcriptional regulator [Ohtaekwangia sp.]|uniref:AraC family transcriptional regulator n=1 Tax=Ohtaekwangia sp. TaxID=2066019 RepID=UPI002F95F1EB